MHPRLFLTLALSLLSCTSIASLPEWIKSLDELTWVGSVTGGSSWAGGGKTQTFFLTPEIEKSYVARNVTHDLAIGEVFLGAQKSLPMQWLSQIGFTLATTSNVKLQGDVWDDAEPQFDNYSYQYKLRTTRVALKGTLLLNKGYWFMPWLSASMGVGFNRAHGYNNMPLIFQAVADSNFADHTTSSFSYTLGVGVQTPINPRWQIGLGYEFADWGKSALAPSSGQTMNRGLALNHLHTNNVLCNLTYIAQG